MFDRFSHKHRNNHAALEAWCEQAFQLLCVHQQRITDLEKQVADLNARIAEWKRSPR